MQISVGNYDFKTLVSNGVYVDKTEIIDEILRKKENGEVIVASRPRRFGKSLMLSMLNTFFDENDDAGHYFDGLSISKKDTFKYHNSVPTLNLSFKNAESTSIDAIFSHVRDVILTAFDEYNDHDYEAFLTKQEQSCVREILSKSSDYSSLENALYILIKLKSSKSKRKCYVFIDEYDLPIFSSCLINEDNTIGSFFKHFYNAGLKGNNYLGFALLTGVMNSAKDSLSSGLNNVTLDNGLYTAFSKEYFAFNEEEVIALSKKCGEEIDINELVHWYGGYSFYEKKHFNPWSVVSFLASKQMFLVYWASTGSSAMIYNILKENTHFDASLLLRLMSGDGIEMSSDFSISFVDMNHSLQGALVEFCALGYLTASYDRESKRIKATIPNKEILQVFQNEINNRFIGITRQSAFIQSMRDAIINGDAKTISIGLERILSALSTDYFSDESRYQVIMLVIANLTMEDYLVREEMPSGIGISDILILPKKTNLPGAIIEVKTLKARSSEDRLKKSANSALTQIKEKDYGEILRSYGAKPILYYGISCAGKKAAVVLEKVDS